MDRTSRSRGPPGPPPRDQPRYHYSSSHHRVQKQSASTNQPSNGSTKQSGSEKNPFFTPTPTPSPSPKPKPSERQCRKRRYHEMNHHQPHHSQLTTRQPVSYNHPPANLPIHHSGHPPTKRFRHGITPNTSHTMIPQPPQQPVVTVKITNTHQFKAGLQNFQNTNGIHSTSINHNVPRTNHRGGGHNQYQTRHYQNQNIHQNVHQNVHGNVHRSNHQNQSNTRGRGRGGHGGKSYADIQNRRREVETDFHRITQRMRQIDIGKNTPEYKHYIATVPRHMRSRNIKEHPRTPNPREKMPNKWWKAALKNWRKSLHKYDPPPMTLPPANGGTHSHGLNNRNGGNAVNKVDDGFCCEKCSLSLPTFEKWQLHRADCDGKKLAEIQPPPPPPKKPNKAAKAPKVSDPRRAGHGTVKREREWSTDIRNVERGNREKQTKPVIKEEEKRVESEKESENEDDDLDSLSDIESEPEEEPVKMKKEATSYLVDEYAIPEINTKSNNAQSAGLLDQLDSILNDSDSDGDW